MKDRVTGRNARENIQKIVDECLHFVQNFDMEHDNLLFYGATGVGKTFLTHCIAKELLESALGTEMTNTFVASQLFLCINERLMNKKSTIISTNLSLESLRDLYSERVFSRISSNFKMRKLIGKDIRLMKKLGEQG